MQHCGCPFDGYYEMMVQMVMRTDTTVLKFRVFVSSSGNSWLILFQDCNNSSTTFTGPGIQPCVRVRNQMHYTHNFSYILKLVCKRGQSSLLCVGYFYLVISSLHWN